MRPAQEVMADLAASGLNAEQIALVIELSTAVATEARPIVDDAAIRRRARDREYQAERRGNRQSRQKSADKPTPLKKDQNPGSVSDETGGKPTDPVKELFDLGVSVLMATGMVEKEARTYVGKLRKERGDGLAMAALTECRTRSISNPVEWLPKWFERQQASAPVSFLDHKLNQERAAAGASP